MATWKELKRFCEKDNWTLYKDSDHYYYRKILDNGDILRTKVSKGTGEIGKDLFKKILKHQLRITKEEFNKKI